MKASTWLQTSIHRAVPIIALTMIAFISNLSADRDVPKLIKTIYWSDGDSGRIDGTHFRLADVDAPETGPVGKRGGAKCEAERVLGYEAKTFMVRLTTGAELHVAMVHGTDRYDRLVTDIKSDGINIASEAVIAGYLEPWPHA